MVIKEAHTGATVTFLGKNHYRAMIYEHVNNQNKNQNLGKNLAPLL